MGNLMDSNAFRERPFPTTPAPAAYFPAESLEQTRTQIERCIERAEGVGLVIGAPGMGKSLLLARLSEQYKTKFRVANLAGTAVGSRRALLQSILFELGLPYRGLEEGELRLSLMDHLHPTRQCPHGMLLLIDDAHTLSLRLLEEIRLLTNFVREGKPRVRLVLAGSAELDERLANPKLDSFNQRIAARCYLQGWNRNETAEYVRCELTRCGVKSGELFRDDALRAIYLASAGIPRLVNQLCDHALLLSNTRPLTAACIQAAWSDLQRLPGPWNEPSPNTSTALEFADLEDSEVEALACIAVPAEPLVPSAEELFGMDFEEEVVVDRFVHKAAVAAKMAPAVEKSPIKPVAAPVVIQAPGLKIAQLLAEERPATIAIPARESVAPLAKQVAQALRYEQEPLDPALDPVYPEDDEVHEEANFQPPTENTVRIDAAEFSPPPPHSRTGSGSARFRSLFASLRGKQ